jgi:Arc/MetJ-type ribon-helix-helix transcriptional regulator
MKKKIAFPVSLDKDLVDWIISMTESGEFRNRSHVVETALKKFRKEQEVQK